MTRHKNTKLSPRPQFNTKQKSYRYLIKKRIHHFK